MIRTLVSLFLCAVALEARATDLTVGWISRLPEIDYVWNSSSPKVEGWPAVGETVTWRANVRSWFDSDQQVAYVWYLDGQPIGRGKATLAADSYTAIDLPRRWDFDRRRLSIVIDAGNRVAEESETNNSLEIFTDALSVGFWVEQSLYDYFRSHQHELGSGTTSWENWAQRLVELYNDMAAIAVYEETPRGVIDRWRIQKIVVVPDGALPLVPPVREQLGREPKSAHTQPNSQDRTVDLQWGFTAGTIPGYSNHTTRGTSNPFDIAPAVLHELGHARYLIDVYALDVAHAPPFSVLEIEGLDIRATHFRTPEQGLMNRDYTFIDRYSAIALNRIAGHRAISGNYNDPENLGSFLNDLPAENRLTIRDAEGNLLTDAAIEIYQSRLDVADEWYAKHYDATPDLRLQTDAYGQVLVGRNPFSNDGPVFQYWRGANSVAIVRATKDGVTRTGFLESRLFNLAWWRGDTYFADHELVVGRPLVCGSTGPRLISPTWEQNVTSNVELAWAPLARVSSYRVFAASPAQPQPQLLGETTSTSLRVSLSGRTYWWVEASFTDGCPAVRSAASRLVIAPGQRRRAVR